MIKLPVEMNFSKIILQALDLTLLRNIQLMQISRYAVVIRTLRFASVHMENVKWQISKVGYAPKKNELRIGLVKRASLFQHIIGFSKVTITFCTMSGW
jgi:hypothetical protein